MWNKIVDGLTVLIFAGMFSTLFTTDAEITNGFMLGWLIGFALYSVPVLLLRKVLLMFGGLFKKGGDDVV